MAGSTEPASNSISLGGAGMTFNRKRLLRWFQAAAACYLGYFYFTAQLRSFEILVLTGALIVAALLPSYLWCAGKAHGLPIVPVFALSTFPTYILPIQRGSEVLDQFSSETEAKALLTLTLFLLLITGVWQQMCNNPGVAPKTCRMMQVEGSNWILVLFLVLGMLFQIGGLVFYQLSGGLFTLLRGYTSNGAMLAMFVFAFRLGTGGLSLPLKTLLFGVVGLLIVIDATSFILAGTLVRLAVIGAGYTLGSQKIPWKTATVIIALLAVLHAGKAEMRAIYWKEGQGSSKIAVLDYPGVFAEWVGAGIRVLQTGKDVGEERESAADRSALVKVLFRIIEWTPEKKPFLEGETYRGIPALLIPRVLYKEKGIAHMANWILAYQYEFLTMEELGKTSVGFDLMSEAYANYGYTGIGFLAVFLALFYGFVGKLSTGVPLLSMRFLFAVLVLSGTISSNNTMGVFVTTLWQSTMALLTVGILLMKKGPNPLYLGKDSISLSGGRSSPEGIVPSSVKKSAEEGGIATKRNERPKRFVYGEKKGK